MKRCRICGLTEAEHHDPDWIEQPEGCVCHLATWNCDVIPPVCDNLREDLTFYCPDCEHSVECHKETGQ